MKKAPVWFEKTVEYAYVARLVLSRKMGFAAPLAGVHERYAGDAVFGVAEKFILIEFKRTREFLPSEISLFLDYEKAKKDLSSYTHHYFIYGVLEEGALQLRAEHYFDTNEEKFYYNPIDILACGIPKQEFDTYIKLLAAHKVPDGRAGSAGGMTPETFSTVLGVSQKGDVVETHALHEYAPDLFPAPPRPDHTPSPQQKQAPTPTFKF